MTEGNTYKLYLPFWTKVFLFGMLFIFLGVTIVMFILPFVITSTNPPPPFIGFFWLVVLVGNLFWILRFPHEIVLYNDGTIDFKSVIRKVQMQATEIKSIKPANGTFGFLVVMGKKNVRLLAQFDNFHEFILKLKQYNPTVITRGC